MWLERSFTDSIESSKGFGLDFEKSGSSLNGIEHNVPQSALCFKMITLATLWKIDWEVRAGHRSRSRA